MTDLKRLKLALFQYRVSYYLPILKLFLCTDSGFCYHFDNDRRLRERKPLPESLKKQVPSTFNGGYWFKSGEIGPRINCLKNAIKLECLKNS